MKFYLIIFFIIILSSISISEECDWKVEIYSDNIFLNKTDFEFGYRIAKISGGRANMTLNGSIETVYGEILRNYNRNIINVVERHAVSDFSPDLNDGVYLIKGEIFPDCNDTMLENNVDYKLVIILPDPVILNYLYIKINEFMPDPVGDENALMPDGEWVELYNSADFAVDLEGLILNDNYGNGLIISNTNIIQNTTVMQPRSYLVVYKNGDGKLTLTNDGFEKVKIIYEDRIIDEVSYSHAVEGLSWSRVSGVWTLAIPTPNEENHLEEPDLSSNININNVYLDDNKAKFGDLLRVRLNIYKGDTSKYNLDLYMVDENDRQVSKRSEINIEEKFTNHTLIVPLQIEPNCNMKYKNGTYKIIFKGLDSADAKEIKVEGITDSLCQTIKEKSFSQENLVQGSAQLSQIKNKNYLDLVNYSNPVTSSVIYESSDIKAKNLGLYFFCAVLIILIIYLIFKKSL